MKNQAVILTSVLVSCLIVLSFAAVTNAKPTLSLNFYKDNGYGMGNDMNGLWTINTAVSDNTTHVEFYVDNQLQLNDTAAPFSWQFNTENYTEGVHTIKVAAYDFSGESALVERQPNFAGFPVGFVAGIIAIVVVVFVIALIISAYRIKKAAAKKQAQGY